MKTYIHAYFSSLKQKLSRLTAGLALGGLCAVAAAGCGATPQDQKLGQQTFTYTIPPTGLPTGFALPPIPCADVSTCNSFIRTANINLPGLTTVCEANFCAADLKLTILYVIDAVNVTLERESRRIIPRPSEVLANHDLRCETVPWLLAAAVAHRLCALLCSNW